MPAARPRRSWDAPSRDVTTRRSSRRRCFRSGRPRSSRGARPPVSPAARRRLDRPVPGALAEPAGPVGIDDGGDGSTPGLGIGAPRRREQLLGRPVGDGRDRSSAGRSSRTRSSSACSSANPTTRTCPTRRRTTGSSSPTARSRKECSAADTTSTHLPPGPARRTNPLCLRENVERATPLIETVRHVASTHDGTPAQVALAWLVRQPNVVAIPGASSVEQLRHNVAAADLDLRTTRSRR